MKVTITPLRIVLMSALTAAGLATLLVVVSLSNTISVEGIVIHHSAVIETFMGDPISVAAIDAAHRRRGFGAFYWGKTYHIGYHYVIFPDGRVERGRPERVRGAHAAGHNSWLGICLIGNFEQHAEADDEAAVRPTAAQMVALTKLTRALMAKYQIDAARVLPHGALDARTACPGHRFPWKSFFAELAAPAS